MIRVIEVIYNDTVRRGSGDELSPVRQVVEILTKDGKVIAVQDNSTFTIEQVVEICTKVKEGVTIKDAINGKD